MKGKTNESNPLIAYTREREACYDARLKNAELKMKKLVDLSKDFARVTGSPVRFTTPGGLPTLDLIDEKIVIQLPTSEVSSFMLEDGNDLKVCGTQFKAECEPYQSLVERDIARDNEPFVVLNGMAVRNADWLTNEAYNFALSLKEGIESNPLSEKRKSELKKYLKGWNL